MLPSLATAQANLDKNHTESNKYGEDKIPKYFITGDDMRISVVSSEADINSCTDAMCNQIIDSTNDTKYIALDCEWDTIKNSIGMVTRSKK